MSMDYEHPDVSSALRSGFASYQNDENTDCQENRDMYIEEHTTELVKWLRLGHPEILDEFIEFSHQACRVGYFEWLN